MHSSLGRGTFKHVNDVSSVTFASSSYPAWFLPSARLSNYAAHGVLPRTGGDKDSVTQLSYHYEIFEEKSTPATFLLPWFPSSAKKAKEKATRNLHTMLAKYVELRRNAAVLSSDVIDESIAEGCNNENVIAVRDCRIYHQLSNRRSRVCCWGRCYRHQ